MSRFFLLLISVHLCAQSPACTTFFIHHGEQMVFGRNYDWVADAGMLCTNLRGLKKTSLKTPDGTTTSWESKYGSITFNQYGKEFPTGGMNEAGLVVELMWLDGTKYPSPDDRPAIGVLQWIQYQLDNCGSVDEIIATDKNIRITSAGTPLHYLVADAKGNAATIEFLNGKMVVHKGNSLPYAVLTNDTYETSIQSKHSRGNNSLDRFNTACTMVAQYTKSTNPGSIIDHSFNILNKVAQGDFTRWSIVYDLAAKKVFFKTNQFTEIKSLEFSDVDFGCRGKAMVMDLNRAGSGDIKAKLQLFSLEINQKILENTLTQSRERIRFSEAQKLATLNYPESISCKNPAVSRN